MVGKFPEVPNFNPWLFLELNWFICNLPPVLPGPRSIFSQESFKN